MSAIETTLDVVTTAPEVETVRSCTAKFSVPSVRKSLTTENLMVPVLLEIVILPKIPELVKSADDAVPVLVQNSRVPLSTLVVCTVNNTSLPSLTAVLSGVMVYVGGVFDVSTIDTTLEVVTILPAVDTVRNCRATVSVPSVSRSLDTMIGIVAVLLLITTLPKFNPLRLEKSAADTVPVLVQNRVVPVVTPVVTIDHVTVLPSLTVSLSGVIV